LLWTDLDGTNICYGLTWIAVSLTIFWPR